MCLGSTIPNAMQIGGVTDALSAIIMAPAFLFVDNFAGFLVPFFVSFTLMFVNMVSSTNTGFRKQCFVLFLGADNRSAIMGCASSLEAISHQFDDHR